MLERILPAGVAVATRRDDLGEAGLLGGEEAVVAAAVEKRRREFTTGRACARDALAQLGMAPQEIPSGPRGEPCWPEGIVGSITHCDGFRGSAVARRAEYAAIGVDAEVDAPLPQGVLGDIALAGERQMLASLAQSEPGPSWDRLLFSIKESVYKAWFPLAGRWLGFEDASVEINPQLRMFRARLLVAGPELEGRQLSGFAGRWLVREGIVVTAIAVGVGRSLAVLQSN
jgi:4'-phosphopantetheinyl transferase EntD